MNHPLAYIIENYRQMRADTVHAAGKCSFNSKIGLFNQVVPAQHNFTDTPLHESRGSAIACKVELDPTTVNTKKGSIGDEVLHAWREVFSSFYMFFEKESTVSCQVHTT